MLGKLTKSELSGMTSEHGNSKLERTGRVDVGEQVGQSAGLHLSLSEQQNGGCL